MNCKQCRAWTGGTCHRHPPQVVWAGGTMFSAFPVTKPEESCLDFLPLAQPVAVSIPMVLATPDDVLAAQPSPERYGDGTVKHGLPPDWKQTEPINRARGTTPDKPRPKPARTA
jgi:hypothetical protein